jgi:hypothetical protein
MENDFVELKPPERSRTYIYVDRDLVITDVTRICIRPSGSHRLETVNGMKYIVAPGWIAIKIDVDSWTF